MKQINEHNNNTPEAYDAKFNGSLGVYDMERHYKMSQHFKGGIYIDVGCFDSIMPILLAERDPKNKVWAIDYAPKMIGFLQQRFPNVFYECEDVSKKLPFEDNFADYIAAGEFIEHLTDPAVFIKECMRVLKPGGWLAISTPFEEKGNEVGGPYHMWQWSKEDIEKLLDTTDTEIIKEANYNTILAWKQKE